MPGADVAPGCSPGVVIPIAKRTHTSNRYPRSLPLQSNGEIGNAWSHAVQARLSTEASATNGSEAPIFVHLKPYL